MRPTSSRPRLDLRSAAPGALLVLLAGLLPATVHGQPPAPSSTPDRAPAPQQGASPDSTQKPASPTEQRRGLGRARRARPARSSVTPRPGSPTASQPGAGQTGTPPATRPGPATRPNGTTRPTGRPGRPGARPGTAQAPASDQQEPEAGAGASTPGITPVPPGGNGRARAPEGETFDDDSLYSCEKARGKFKLNLAPDIELKDLVTWAFSFTCKNFIYSSALGTRAAKVTIKSPEAMTARQAWSVFLVALQSMGLTVVPKGNVLEIVEYAQAKMSPLPIYTRGRPANSDQMVRAVLRPEHLPVDDVAAILGEIKSKDGAVRGIPKAGVVVVTDFGSHISKMGSLLLAVDQPVLGERLYMLRVKYADATEMAQTLGEILGTRDAPAQPGGAPPNIPPRPGRRRGREPAPGEPPAAEQTSIGSEAEVESAVPSKVLADERTNSLILLASEPAYLRVRALVNRLDVSIDVEGAGRIHVYPLENADAEEMATTLTAVISGIQQPSGGQGQGQGRQGQNVRQQETPRTAATADSAAAFEGVVRVTHDKPTNSLVVVASVKDFLALREVLRKLDVVRKQVYIEASIVEIGIDNSRDLGASWHAGAEVGDGDLVLGGVQHGNLSSLNVATVATATGLIGGALGHILPGAQELLGQSIPSYGILFQALATSSNLDVLSSPHILTTDNEEAEISVGQNIPYQSALVGLPGGATGGATGSFFPTQSIQRQDVELNLKITPQINASDEVKLKIDLTINDIASQDFAGLGPSWSKKTLKDTVVVRDQQAVVLGGLISDKVTNTESKVPLLGDIPILGYLFKFTGKRKEKRNLLIVLTPYIVHNQNDLEKIVERRVREQREFMRTYSTFRDIKYRPETDFGRKRGLVSEVNRLLRQVEKEVKVLEEMDQKQVGFPDGPVEYLPERPVEEPPPEEGEKPASDTEEARSVTTDGEEAEATPAVESTDGAATAPAAPAKGGKKKKSKKGKAKPKTAAAGKRAAAAKRQAE